MDVLQWPEEAEIVSCPIRPNWVGRTRQESRYSTDAVLVDYQPMRFTGSVEIAEVGRGSREYRAIRAFLAGMQGSRNIVELPHGVDAVEDYRVQIAQIDADGTAHYAAATLAETFADGQVPAGTYARLERAGAKLARTYMLTQYGAQVAGRWPVRLMPSAPLPSLADGDVHLVPADTIRIRFAEETMPDANDGDFAGPWRIDWQEAV